MARDTDTGREESTAKVIFTRGPLVIKEKEG